jgi:hypothetical protein
MLPTEDQLVKMPLTKVEHLLHGCSPGSDKWNLIWPVYETKRRRSESKRTVIYFGISTTIALVALIRSFFPAPQKADYPPAANSPRLRDPLGLFHSNPPLENCLQTVNRSDPLGIRTDDPAQDRQRQACIAQYSSSR